MLDEVRTACRLVFKRSGSATRPDCRRYGDLILFEINTKALDRDDIRALIVHVLQAETRPGHDRGAVGCSHTRAGALSEPPEAPVFSAEPILS